MWFILAWRMNFLFLILLKLKMFLIFNIMKWIVKRVNGIGIEVLKMVLILGIDWVNKGVICLCC